MIFWTIGVSLVLTAFIWLRIALKDKSYKQNLLKRHNKEMTILKKENEWLDMENEPSKALNQAIRDML